MGRDPDSPSASPSSQPSGRKGSKKVRTGCKTCKVRKVKCDEAKPFCMRCTKTGRTCDGYLDVKSLTQRRRKSVGEPQGLLPSFYRCASADEKRSFDFFQHVTAPCLSADFDGMLWQVLVLQICQTEPAVRHAILAVSTLHESMVYSDSSAEGARAQDFDRQSFALWQYNKAIASLLSIMGSAETRPLVPLLTCVLFVFIEFMQSKDRESLLHLEQGRHILNRIESKLASVRSSDIELIKQHLVPMYTRLSLTSFMIGGCPVQIPEVLKLMHRIPAVFETIDQVRYALYELMEECFRFARRARPVKYTDQVVAAELRALEQEQDYLLGKMAKFRVAFSLYQVSGKRDAPPGSLELIQVHMHITSIWVATALAKNETAYDDHLGAFSAIIPLASSLIDSLDVPSKVTTHGASNMIATPWNNNAEDLAGMPSQPASRRFFSLFTFEVHFIAPLYYVATKCRHPLIRRAALDLLKRNPARRENLWRAGIMAAIADNMIKLEEKHLHDGSVSPPPEPRPVPSSNNFTPECSLTAVTGAENLPVPAGYKADLATSEAREPGMPWYGEPVAHPIYSGASYTPYADVGSYGVSTGMAQAANLGDEDFKMPADMGLTLDPVTPKAGAHVPAPSSSMKGPPSIYISDPVTPGPTSDWQDSSRDISSTSHESDMAMSGNWFDAGHYSPDEPASLTTWRRRPDTASAASDMSRQSSNFGIPRSVEQEWLQRRNLEAPFDVREELRVHDAIIGPEKEDGSWVMMFRKLNGLEGDWDLQTTYIPALTA